MLWFTRLARRNGLRTLVIEHASDIFTVNNPAKLAFLALPIVTGRSANGQFIMRRQKVAEPEIAEGRPLEEVATRDGEGLRDYHHRKLAEVLGRDRPDVLDLREIFPSRSLRPSAYYLDFFKILSGPLVLLEDFVVDNQTARFFRGTVLPAWQRAVSEDGRRPQVARLGPHRRTSSPMWSAYPATAADNPAWVRPHRSVSDGASPMRVTSVALEAPKMSRRPRTGGR
jgi:hypothetical protein